MSKLVFEVSNGMNLDVSISRAAVIYKRRLDTLRIKNSRMERAVNGQPTRTALRLVEGLYRDFNHLIIEIFFVYDITPTRPVQM